jgi:superfamily I DNA and RNA helicase
MDLEMLFENYLNEVEWISAEIEEIVDEVTNTEENVVLLLDLLRNRILRFELVLSVATFVITCGALITGRSPYITIMNHTSV